MKKSIVIWKDGTYLVVVSGQTWEYENDKDWLTTIALDEIETHETGHLPRK